MSRNFVIENCPQELEPQVKEVFLRSWFPLCRDLGLDPNAVPHGEWTMDATRVAMEGPHILGFTTLRGYELERIYLTPGAQGTGLGAALINDAVEHGVTYLWVDEGNSRARRFYEKNDWRATDEITFGRHFPNSPVRKYRHYGVPLF